MNFLQEIIYYNDLQIGIKKFRYLKEYAKRYRKVIRYEKRIHADFFKEVKEKLIESDILISSTVDLTPRCH